MGDILVCGNVNLETTLRVETFPIAYTPVNYPFFGISSQVAGVGYNVARALTTLGDRARFASLTGLDLAGRLVEATLEADGIAQRFVVRQLAQTPQSVVIVDRAGERQVNTDLKDIPRQTYPVELLESALRGCSLAVLTNVNYARPFLQPARQAGAPVVTDLHDIADLDSEHNRAFMEAADILFMSHRRLPCPAEAWARRLVERYGTEVVVVGLGAGGALLSVKRDGFLGLVPAVRTREVVNTVGAGDALLSAFVHYYTKTPNPYAAIEKAVVFASYKIGEDGASRGFLDEPALDRLHAELRRGD